MVSKEDDKLPYNKFENPWIGETWDPLDNQRCSIFSEVKKISRPLSISRASLQIL